MYGRNGVQNLGGRSRVMLSRVFSDIECGVRKSLVSVQMSWNLPALDSKESMNRIHHFVEPLMISCCLLCFEHILRPDREAHFAKWKPYQRNYKMVELDTSNIR